MKYDEATGVRTKLFTKRSSRRDDLTSQSALVFVTAMLVAGSSYVALVSVSGHLPRSSVTATYTSTFSIVGSTHGFPRESNGGWMVHTVGSDPTPEGCRNLVAATFHEGYSLKTYLSSNAVKAGG